MVTDPSGAADVPALELEVPAGAEEVAAGAAGVPADVPVRVAELPTGGAAEVEYSLAVEDELDDGPVVELGAALSAVDRLPVDEGVALGPGTSTWTFGGAPSGWGITMIGPTRTGPTCTGPTVIGAGSPSVVASGVEEVTGGAVVEIGVELAGGGASASGVSAGGVTSEREAVADGAPVRGDVARSFEAAGGWIGSTVLEDVDGLVRCRGCCWSLVPPGEVMGARRLAEVPRSLGAGAAGSDDGSTTLALD